MMKKRTDIKVEDHDGVMVLSGIDDENNYTHIVVDDEVKVKLTKIKKFLVKDFNCRSFAFADKGGNKGTGYTLSELINHVMDYAKPKYLQRFKGLGEMNSEVLFKTTMDPENRTLVQVTMDDWNGSYEELDTHLSKKSSDKRKVSIDKFDIAVEDLDR